MQVLYKRGDEGQGPFTFTPTADWSTAVVNNQSSSEPDGQDADHQYFVVHFGFFVHCTWLFLIMDQTTISCLSAITATSCSLRSRVP